MKCCTELGTYSAGDKTVDTTGMGRKERREDGRRIK
jgi:hypothetical protein